LLRADLVHRQRRAEHIGAGVRNAERFQQTLQNAVFAAAVMTVQDVEDARHALRHQVLRQRGNAVDGIGVDPFTHERLEHIAAGVE
jgi:hypothetical protein